MENRTATKTVSAEVAPVTKSPAIVPPSQTTSANAQPTQMSQQQQQQPQQQARQKVKQPGVSYRATLQKLSNTISLSSAEILERYEKTEPSLTLHFYKNHWKFENQDGVFLYNSPARQILEAIRNEQIPVDCLEVFRDVKVRYYEGCLIVRLVDHREDPPTVMHTALRPSPESIWTEMLLYSEQTQGNFTDAKALQVESDILVATHPPLDLRPALHPEHSAWLLRDIKDRPLPRMKRKRQALHEDDEEERLMYLYDERHGKEFAPDFKRLAFVEAHRKKRQQQQQQRNAASAADATKAAATAVGPSTNAIANVSASAGVIASPHLMNGQVRRTSQSPVVTQQAMQSSPQTQSVGTPGGHMVDRSTVSAHMQQQQQQARMSASPQLGPRQLSNQQALAPHIAQQTNALQNGGPMASPRMASQLPPNVSHAGMVNDLARQQQIMLQQRAMAIGRIRAAREAQAASPRVNANGQLQAAQLGGAQGTPTPLQMQQIRQLQAQQQQQQHQQQQFMAQHHAAAQNAQYHPMR